MRVTNLGQALLLLGIVSMTGALPARAAAATDASIAPAGTVVVSSASKRPQFVLNLPLLYVYHGGSSFDGHQGYVFQTDRVAHLPKLSAGLGLRPGVGVLITHIVPSLSTMATLNLEWSRHAAQGYNAGGVAYDRDAATLLVGSLELRAILDFMRLKPFVGIAPGYGWLSLPAGVRVVDSSTRNTSWADITLRGFTVALAAGASYPFTEYLSAEASIGYRLHYYSASSVGAVSGLGANPGLFGGLGASLRF